MTARPRDTGIRQRAEQLAGAVEAARAVTDTVANQLTLALIARSTHPLEQLARVSSDQLDQLASAAKGMESAGISVLGFIDPKLARGARQAAEISRVRAARLADPPSPPDGAEP